MTRRTDDLDADIERMLTIRRNRQQLGFSYYEPNPGASRQTADRPQRVNKSRAGQPNWRRRWPPKGQEAQT